MRMEKGKGRRVNGDLLLTIDNCGNGNFKLQIFLRKIENLVSTFGAWVTPKVSGVLLNYSQILVKNGKKRPKIMRI
jgi:hypothetical protein